MTPDTNLPPNVADKFELIGRRSWKEIKDQWRKNESTREEYLNTIAETESDWDSWRQGTVSKLKLDELTGNCLKLTT